MQLIFRGVDSVSFSAVSYQHQIQQKHAVLLLAALGSVFHV